MRRRVVIGIVALGVLAVFAAAGLSSTQAGAYLSDNPGLCVTCHVMQPQFESYFHSAHREPATCNDCHVRQGPVVSAFSKMTTGARHLAVYMSGSIPDVIRISESGRQVVQQNCLNCHGSLVADTSLNGGKFCADCHRSTPHGD